MCAFASDKYLVLFAHFFPFVIGVRMGRYFFLLVGKHGKDGASPR